MKVIHIIKKMAKKIKSMLQLGRLEPVSFHGETSEVENFSVQREICINQKRYIVRGDSYLQRIGEEFEPGLVRLFVAIASRLDNCSCFDVGANIGLTTLLFSELYEQVYSFEASPRTFQILDHNIASNKIGNANIFRFGLGSKTQKLLLTAANDDASGGFLSEDISADLDGHLHEMVDIRKGDEWIEGSAFEFNLPVAFVKIDVEGHELEVIEGLKQTLRRFEPIVVMEMNHWCLNAFKRLSIPEFLESLEKTFSVIYAFNDSTSEMINISCGKDRERYHVMHQHIVHNQFPTLIASQSANVLEDIIESMKLT